MTKHADVEVISQTVKNMFDLTQIKLHKQRTMGQIYACPNEQHCAYQTRDQNKCSKLFDRMFDALQILSNTTNHDNTETNKVVKR